MERLELREPGPEIWIKREDLSAVKSYKWRGACNRMSVLDMSERKRGVVTASAGNHAQGVALAAKALEINARIYMPRSTPKVKRSAVMKHGGGNLWKFVCLASLTTRRSRQPARMSGNRERFMCMLMTTYS